MTINLQKNIYKKIQNAISIFILVAFIVTSVKSPAYAQVVSNRQIPWMPKPGVMVPLSPEFIPSQLRGMSIHPDNALQFDFLIDKGDQILANDQKREEYKKLVKYFLASLTIPDEDQWVNLSPYEKDRIIKDDFGTTEMGCDLLAQDYLLKQMTSSLTYPEKGLGRKFWNKVYDRALEEYGTTNIPVNTFNKVWIIPDQAAVYEHGNTVYILRNHLKVMLEEDYLSLKKHTALSSANFLDTNKSHSIGSQAIREIILPVLEKEVNEGKGFANLRQMFSGMILAAWYKHSLKESLLGKVYVNKARVKGVDQDPKTNVLIYQQYLMAFKKGVFNYIKEDENQYTKQIIPRKYFSGGMHGFTGVVDGDAAMRSYISGEVIAYKDRNTISPVIARTFDLSTPQSVDIATVFLNTQRDAARLGQTESILGVDRAMSGKRRVADLDPRELKLGILSREEADLPSKVKRAPWAVLKSVLGPMAAVFILLASACGAETDLMKLIADPVFSDSDPGYVESTPQFKELEDLAKKDKNFYDMRDFLRDNSTDNRTINERKWVWHVLGELYAIGRHKADIDALLHSFPWTVWELQEFESGKQNSHLSAVWRKMGQRLALLVPTSTDFGGINGGEAVHPVVEKTDAAMKAKTPSPAEMLFAIAKEEVLVSILKVTRNSWELSVFQQATTFPELIRVFKGLVKKYPALKPELKSLINVSQQELPPEALQELQRRYAFINAATMDTNRLLEEILSAINDGTLTRSKGLDEAKEEAWIQLGIVFRRVPIAYDYLVSHPSDFRGHLFVEVSSNKPIYVHVTLIQDFLQRNPPIDTAFYEIIGNIAPGGTKGIIVAFPPDQAMGTKAIQSVVASGYKGGIDFNAANLNLEIKRDGSGLPLPLAQQDMAQLSRIQGFEPKILEIKSGVNLPVISDLQQKLQTVVSAA